MKKLLKGKLSISHPSRGDDKDVLVIRIEDNLSHSTFVEIEIEPAELAVGLTGLVMRPMEFEVRNLANVGKKRETKELIFSLPDNLNYDERKDTAVILAHELADEGWEPSEYFGSKDSFYTKDGVEYAKTTQSRFVEVEEKELPAWEEKSHFGSNIDYGDKLLDSTSLVILCEMTRGGHKPIKTLLPHQVYKEDLDPKKKYCVMQVNHKKIIEVPDVK